VIRSCIRREDDAALRTFKPDFRRRLGIHNSPVPAYTTV
jgi:hypothetical protein